MLGNVVDKQRADGAAVVGRRDSAVTFLTGRVPNLGLDGLVVDLDGPCRELDTDRRLGLEIELIAGETTQEIGFADTRVSDENHLKKRERNEKDKKNQYKTSKRALNGERDGDKSTGSDRGNARK